MAKLFKIFNKFLLAIIVIWPNFSSAADYTIPPPVKIIDPLSPEAVTPASPANSGEIKPALKSVLEEENQVMPPEPLPSPSIAAPDNLQPITAPPAQASEPAEPNINMPPAPAALKSVGDQLPKTTQKIATIPQFDKTLMFNEEDLKKYRLIYNAYQQRLNNNQLVDNTLGERVGEILGKVTAAEAPPAPTSIYLNSILFRSPGNATAWINGRKYEIGTAANGVKLENITSYSAELQLEASAFADINFEEWQEHFPPVSNFGDVNELAKKDLPLSQQEIRVEPASKTIHFILKPNQRLDIRQKAIREGKDFSKPIQSASDKTTAGPAMPNSQANMPGEPLTPAGAIDTPPANSMNSATSEMEEDAGKTADFTKSLDGHFYIPASLNQQVINFKVDTGATVTAISSQDAEKIGIDVNKLDYKYNVKIADGTIMKAAETRISSFDIDAIKLKDVNILVAKGEIAQPLLGMSLLSQLKRFSIEGDTLTLTQ